MSREQPKVRERAKSPSPVASVGEAVIPPKPGIPRWGIEPDPGLFLSELVAPTKPFKRRKNAKRRGYGDGLWKREREERLARSALKRAEKGHKKSGRKPGDPRHRPKHVKRLGSDRFMFLDRVWVFREGLYRYFEPGYAEMLTPESLAPLIAAGEFPRPQRFPRGVAWPEEVMKEAARIVRDYGSWSLSKSKFTPEGREREAKFELSLQDRMDLERLKRLVNAEAAARIDSFTTRFSKR